MDVRDLFHTNLVINLKRRLDRWTDTLAQFAALELTPIRVDAVDGTTDIPVLDARRYAQTLSAKDPSPAYIQAKLACVRSHRKALEVALSMGLSQVAIFEDDVDFLPGFWRELERRYADVPDDWEVIYLGGRTIKARQVAEGVLRAEKVYCPHACLLRGDAMADLSALLCLESGENDWSRWRHMAKGTTYQLSPALAVQRVSYSDIARRMSATRAAGFADGKQRKKSEL